MTSKQEEHYEYNENVRRSSNGPGILVLGLIVGAFAVALGGWWYQSSQVNSVRNELTQTQQKLDRIQGQMQTSAALSKSEIEESIARMNDQIEKARNETVAVSRSAQTAAKKRAGEVMTQLSAKNQELTQQLDQIKTEYAQKSTQLDETLNGIKGDVGTVKSDVSNTRTELTATNSELKRAFGDLGVLSGLIATNSKELSALRLLGEKDYYEFTLPKTNRPQRVGDIQLALKKADVKRNRFTLDVMADDKRVEKKDKHLNEPVQFYTGGSRAPYEIVINEIRKDQVIGYLAVPKVKDMAKR